MHKGFIKTAALLGAVSVALGAFAAHTLKTILTGDLLNVFDTAVRYQFYHVFALLIAGILYNFGNKKILKWAGRLFIFGIIFFCGSLYLITWIKTAQLNGLNWIGPITPFGGLCFIAGWIMLFVGICKKPAN